MSVPDQAPIVPETGLCIIPKSADIVARALEDVSTAGYDRSAAELEGVIGEEDRISVPYSDARLDSIYAFEANVKGKRIFGTGFAVTSNLLLSAAHNWAEMGNASFRFEVRRYRAGNKHTLMIGQGDEAKSKKHGDDMGALSMNVHRFANTLKIAEIDAANKGQPVTLLGYPQAQSPVPYVAGGTILSVEGDLIYHNVDADEGQSGAPIIDAAGRAIGVHLGGPSASGRAGQNIGHAFNAATIEKIKLWHTQSSTSSSA